jgi:uncharacterized protein with LGFP repeats
LGATDVEDTSADFELFTHTGGHEADEDPDAVDTAPTRVQSDTADDYVGRHAAEERRAWNAVDEDRYVPAPGSLFAPAYGAPPPVEPEAEPVASEVHYDEPVDAVVESAGEPLDDRDHGYQETRTAPPAIHLPLDDPNEVPEGYPIKGSMRTGTYHTPDSATYDSVVAEIWFADAEHAEANGFTRAD